MSFLGLHETIVTMTTAHLHPLNLNLHMVILINQIVIYTSTYTPPH